MVELTDKVTRKIVACVIALEWFTTTEEHIDELVDLF